MSAPILSPEALIYVLQAVLMSGGATESFVLYPDGSVTVRVGTSGARRLSGGWDAALDEWLPLSGDPLPLLHAGQTVGLLWAAPGEVLAAPAAEALAALLAQVRAVPDPWSADQLSGHSALIDRHGRLRAATPGWLALFGLSAGAVGRSLGELRADWRPLEQALPGVLDGHALAVPAWRAAPAGGVAEAFAAELRPWPVTDTELAALFSAWSLAAPPLAPLPGTSPLGTAPGAGPGAAVPAPPPTPGPEHAVFRAIFGGAAQAQWLVTGKGTVLEVNAAAAALEGTGSGSAALLGEPIWSAGVWRGQEGIRRQVRAAALRAGRGETAEVLLELDAGPPWQLRTRPLVEGHVLFELQPLSHEPQDLEWRLALLDVLMAHSREGMVVTDARGRVVLLGGSLYKKMTASGQDVTARDWMRHLELRGVNGEVLEPAQRPMMRTLRGEKVRDEEVTVVSAQGARPVAVSVYLLPGGLGAAALVQDLSEKRRLLGYLSQVTRRDPLTELPNRAAFTDRLGTALEERRHDPDCRYAVLLCELGGLADLTAQFGPVLGQRLWIDCAARFRDVFRGGDLVARFEQGQFAALLARPGGPRGLDRVLDRLRESFSVPFTVAGETFVPELRVGLVPDLGTQASAHATLLSAAQALRPLPVHVPADD